MSGETGAYAPQGAGLPGEHGHVVPGVVDGLVAPEAPGMLGDELAVLADDNALGVGMHLDRTDS